MPNPTRICPPVIRIFLAVCVGMLATVSGGCAGQSSSRSKSSNTAPIKAPTRVEAERIQTATMNFADRYTLAMSAAYDPTQQMAKTSEARMAALRGKILAGYGAIGNAVDPFPLAGLMDMALMVTLTRELSSRPWATEVFGPAEAASIVAVLKSQEADIWSIVGDFLTPAQMDELRGLAQRWLAEHPDQRYVAGARLTDFLEAKQSDNPLKLANSVFGLMRLDPFTGLDPAIREIEESRLLAERAFYYLQHLPVLMTWQVDAIYYRMLTQPEIQRLFEDTATVVANTTRFTDSTGRFVDASHAFQQSVEKFRIGLPDQQATLVGQLDQIVGRQREAVMQQATTQITAERTAAIQQLDTSISTQQGQMAKHLQGLTDQSIERLYQRARSLILITVASVLVALVIYRLIAMKLKEGKR